MMNQKEITRDLVRLELQRTKMTVSQLLDLVEMTERIPSDSELFAIPRDEILAVLKEMRIWGPRCRMGVLRSTIKHLMGVEFEYQIPIMEAIRLVEDHRIDLARVDPAWPLSKPEQPCVDESSVDLSAIDEDVLYCLLVMASVIQGEME